MKVSNRGQKTVRLISLGIVVVCLVIVLMAIFVKKNVTRIGLANQKMGELARDYYENDFYQRFVRDHTVEGEELNLEGAFGKYTQIGFSPVKLRKLIDFSERNHKNMQKYFEHQGFSCDTNGSYALIKPKAPFSAKDYDLSVSLSCKEN